MIQINDKNREPNLEVFSCGWRGLLITKAYQQYNVYNNESTFKLCIEPTNFTTKICILIPENMENRLDK